MKYIYKIISIVLIGLLLTNCTTESKKEEHGHDEHEHEEMPQNKVKISKAQMSTMGIEVGTFQKLNLTKTIKANGQLELPPQNKASLSTLIGGRVKSISIFEGEFVKKGQVLAQLENIEIIQLQREYLVAKSDVEFLENDYLRKKSLFEDSITSSKVFQEVEGKYLRAKAQLNASKGELQLIGLNIKSIEKGIVFTSIPVKSPINGYVRLIDINIGSFVQPQQRMFEIVDNHHIHMGLLVYEKDIDHVEIDQKVIFTLSSHPEKVYEGKIFAVGKAFEDETKAIRVHAEIIGKPHELLPGMYIDARIVEEEASVNALPKNAIVSISGLSYIFVKKSEGKESLVFEKVEVSIGYEDIGFVSVTPLEKISDDAIIATEGAYYLSAEMGKGELEHEH